MIKLINTIMTYRKDNDDNPEQEYLVFLGEVSDLMKSMGMKNDRLSYKIRPDDKNMKVDIITLDLMEHVN